MKEFDKDFKDGSRKESGSKGGQKGAGSGKKRRPPKYKNPRKDEGAGKEGKDLQKHGCRINYADEPAKSNDPAWYGTYPELQRDAGQFSFTWPTGSPVNMDDAVSSSYVTRNPFIAPGVMAIDLMHTIGQTDSPVDAINVAMRNVYSYVRYANSGSKIYDAPDLMIYLLGMNDIYSLWAWLRRVYGVARTYSPTNRYFPVTLLHAMKFDPSIIENLADLRYYINQLAVKLSSMAVPGTMPFTARRLWQYSNIYSDAPNAKAQVYLFNPAYVYKAELNPSTKAGQLKSVAFSPSVVGSTDDEWNLKTISAYIDKLFDLYYASEDYNVMSGDILKAFGSEGIVKFPQTPEDYTVLPLYDEYVRSQIENSCAVSVTQGSSLVTSNTIMQNTAIGTGNLLCSLSIPTAGAAGPSYAVQAATLTGRTIINMHVQSPEASHVFEATRLRPMIKSVNSQLNLGNITTGTEIVVAYRVYITPGDVNTAPTVRAYTSNFIELDNSEETVDVDIISAKLEQMEIWSKFDWAPILYYGTVNQNASSASVVVKDYNFECDVWTTMSTQDIRKLNDTANLSLFNVPLMSRGIAYKG